MFSPHAADQRAGTASSEAPYTRSHLWSPQLQGCGKSDENWINVSQKESRTQNSVWFLRAHTPAPLVALPRSIPHWDQPNTAVTLGDDGVWGQQGGSRK